jgi:UPF0755 protein
MTSIKPYLLAVLGLLIVVGVIFASVFINASWLSKEEAGAPISIKIDSKMTVSEVRSALSGVGLVSSIMYHLYGKIDASVDEPKAGTYEFRKGISYQEIARTIHRGPIRTEKTVRLVEGKTIDENGEALKNSGYDAVAYWALTGRSRNVAPFDSELVESYPFLSSIPMNQSLEGYLFPDTYTLFEDQIPHDLVGVQLDTFQKKVVKPLSEKQLASGMSWHEIITLASVVESEVRTPEDRKIVADLFLRRMKKGMRLQSDATLNYVMDYRNDRPTAEDLAIQSPYNTYDNDGLPPGPISNPSFSSIDAVLNPTPTNYYYFLTDQKGNVYYAVTYDEHLSNKYRVYGK